MKKFDKKRSSNSTDKRKNGLYERMNKKIENAREFVKKSSFELK